MITIAIPTGYLLPGALRLLGGAGVAEVTPEDIGRKLVLRPSDDLTLVTVRPLDVAVYVDHGSADLGIVGKDAPGFDAVVGNPPWEELTVEELAFYARYALRSLAPESGSASRGGTGVSIIVATALSSDDPAAKRCVRASGLIARAIPIAWQTGQ